ncbi:uncharacterized protein LOC130010923 [Patella vulgata]|uniref:uncharacterized protein LOC130010923 n=1 Tax=Patella vulgata TaxID=6465 RepID=UPI0024A97AB1|nr:uncharacterized protein LOC130010923 [Patella vulgata]
MTCVLAYVKPDFSNVPVNEQTLIYFATFCASRLSISYSTIKLYLCDCCLLKLKLSKTDPFRQGVTIKIFKINNDICLYDSCCK